MKGESITLLGVILACVPGANAQEAKHNDVTAKVKEIAWKAYIEAAEKRILAEEGPVVVDNFVLHRAVEGLGGKDDLIHEVRFAYGLGRATRGLILVNAKTGRSLVVFPKRPRSKEEAWSHEGVWKPIAVVLAGRRLPDDGVKAITLRISGDKYKLTVKGEDQADKGTVTLDTSTTPKKMTIKSTEGPNQGKSILAIYEMKNENSMRVCYDLSGSDFPKDFKAPRGTQLYAVGYRRQKEKATQYHQKK